MRQARSAGRPLSSYERHVLRDFIPHIDLECARVHAHAPWYLLKSFSGITRGHRIFFRPGCYDPGTPGGIALLAHELVHVRQYREGMNWFTYLLSAVLGYAASRYELEAFALQRRVLQALG